jgi:hypothetical protein
VSDDPQVASELLVYRVKEPGAPAYISRVVATRSYLRIDEGGHSTGYLLLDRRDGTIYNISDEDRTVMHIDPAEHEIIDRPAPEIAVQQSVQADAPRIAGVTPVEVSLMADGTLCRSAVVLPGLLPEAVAGLREYHLVLAAREAATLPHMPPDTMTPCSLALFVYQPDFALQRGMPVQLWGDDGYSMQLVDFNDDFAVSETLFELPLDYRPVTLSPGG